MASLYSIAASMNIDVKQFKSQLGSAQKSLNMFQNSLGAVNKAMGAIAIGGLAAITAGLGKLAKQTVQTGMAFEKSMAQLAAVKGFTDGSAEAERGIKKLEKTARELGKSTAYSATQASDAMIELGRAGLTAAEISGAIAPSLFLAGSSASDLTSATSLMAATMKQFSLDTSDASRVADVFTIAQQETMLSMESLTNAMKFAGTVGSAMSMSLEETTAAVGMFRDLGVQGATAGTQFRQMMISLANPTKKAQDTLEKFGLTVDDVNPQVKGFRGILETLAKSNMDLADITNLVSKRASASVTKLVSQFKAAQNSVEGTTFKYDDLLQKFEEGGGRAETTYNAMIDNVAGRFDILKSAFEEFQLTIYDTFSEPLKEVIGGDDTSGLIGLVNTFTETFQASGAVFQQMFSEMFGETLQNINQNQTEIAAGFISIISSAVKLGQTVVSLVPHFVTLFKVAVAWIVTAKIFAFAKALVVMVTGIKAGIVAFGGLRAATMAFIAASGGILPLIAAFATLVTIITSFAVASSKAAKEQANVTESINSSRDAIARFNKERVSGERGAGQGVGTGIERTKNLNAIEQQIHLEGQLTDELKRGFNTLDNMTEAQENKAIADGKMFSILVGGKQILVDHAQALRLENTALNENGAISDQLVQKQEAINKAREEATAQYKADRQAIEDVKEAIRVYNEENDSGRTLSQAVARASGNFSQELQKVAYNGNNAEEVLQQMINKLGAAEQGFVRADQAADNFNEQLAQAEEQRRKQEAEAEQKAAEEKKKKRADDFKKRQKEMKKAIEARIKLEQKLQDQIDVIRAKDSDKASVLLQQRFNEVRKVYNEELKFIGSNLAKRRQLELDYLQTITLLTEEANAKRLQGLIDTAEQVEQQNEFYGKNEIQRIREQTKARIDQLKEERDEIIKNNETLANERVGQIITDMDSGALSGEEADVAMAETDSQLAAGNLEAEKAFIQARNAVQLQGGRELAEALEAIDNEIAQSRLDVAKQSVLQELEANQQVAVQRLKEAGATNAQLEKLEAIHRQQRLNAEEELISQFVKPYGEYTDQIDKLNKKSNSAFLKGARERATREVEFLEEKIKLEEELARVRAETAGLSEEDQASAVGRVQSEIDQLTESFEKSTSFLGKFKEGLATIGIKSIQALGKAFQKFGSLAAGALQGVISLGNNLLSTFTGGTEINPFQMITGAAGDQVAQQEEQQGQLDEALASGQITQEQFDERSQQLVDPAEIAKEFVGNIVSEAKNMAMAIATQAPLIIAELAVAIPELVDLLVENIPKVIIALGEGLPTVVLALIDGIIELLPVLADALLNNALPNIIDGIVVLLTEKLPELADTLLPIVTDLVEFIVTEAPKIVDALIEALPDVVDFLVQGVTEILTGIPKLLKTLLGAIPTIITELLGGVSELVMAVFDAVPLIIEEVIKALPDIISSLIRGILDVIVAIAQALPGLINEIINLLPLLLEGILTLIPEIIIALVEALPLIIEGLIKGLPDLITTLITLVPQVVFAIIKALPQIAVVLIQTIFTLALVEIPKLVVLLVEEVLKGIGQGIKQLFVEIGDFFSGFGDSITEALDSLKVFFKDVIKEIVSLGAKETETFGDTPGPIVAGSSGFTASFAPNDYIIAAQRPMDLMKQAMQALGSSIPKSVTNSVAQAFPPQSSNESSRGSTTNVNIIAEGRLLDEIQITALDRGHAPKLERKLKKNRGTKVGFDRGRFNLFGK